jgi:tetratricopeptide (TPR) repeat protein
MRRAAIGGARAAALAGALGMAAWALAAGPEPRSRAATPVPRPAPAAGSPTSPAPRPGSPEWLWITAKQAVTGDSAAARYSELVRRHPHHPLGRAALVELADYQYARGDYQAARLLYRRSRGPEARRARLGEALCTYALGDPGEARRAAQSLLHDRSDPLTWLAALLVAQSWEAEGRVPEALAAYRRVLELPTGPAEPAALLGAARTARRAGESAEAARSLALLRTRYAQSPEAAEARDLDRPEADHEPGSQAAAGAPAPPAKGGK